MNFLAHLWLAERSATSLAGAILGDVVRGSDLSAYPDELALGVRLHRRVDALTDRHPQIVAVRGGFPADHRRYAGIVIDLACDYALATDWQRHSAESLPAFCRRAAAVVARSAGWFELAGGRAPDAAGFAELLLSYARADGVDRAIARVARRMREPQRLLDAAADWPRHAEALQPRMPALLSDLSAAITQRSSTPSPASNHGT